jgi:curved DNA-binding protein CbpA
VARIAGDTSAGGGRGTPGAQDLERELARLATANPFEVLGVSLDATRAHVRAAYLRLTKIYHPNRFARMDRTLLRLANEVFVRVKDAYTRLSDDATRQKLVEALAPPAQPPTPTPTPRADTATFRGGAASPDAARARPADPASQRSKRPSPPSPSPERPPASTTRGMPVAGGRDLQAAQDTARKRNEEYEAALKLLSQGRYADARVVFHRIAAAEPQTKKYRVQLHYAWGLEHEDAGRIDDARKEFERALAVDPACKRAIEALDRLPNDKKGGGLFKKLFGR